MGLAQVKVAFFQKVRFVFQISQSPQKKYCKKVFWTWNLNKLFTDIGGNFKFRVQDSFFEQFFGEIGRFEKQTSLSEKKTPLDILPGFFSIYF